MAHLLVARVGWSGTAVVGEGVSTFYFQDGATGITAALEDLYDAQKAYFPNTLQWTIPGSGQVIESTTGELVDVWSEGADATVNGGSSNAWAMGAGYRLVWDTSGFVSGRHVKGSTFMVPLQVAMYDTSGTINSALVTIVEAAGAAFITAMAGDFVIWSRPNALGNSAISPVTAVDLPDRVTTLRSRRT